MTCGCTIDFLFWIGLVLLRLVDCIDEYSGVFCFHTMDVQPLVVHRCVLPVLS